MRIYLHYIIRTNKEMTNLETLTEDQLTRRFNKLNREYCMVQKTESSSHTDNEAYLIELKLEDIQSKMSEVSAFFG